MLRAKCRSIAHFFCSATTTSGWWLRPRLVSKTKPPLRVTLRQSAMDMKEPASIRMTISGKRNLKE
eukprot:5676549-Alexandrium_andersonii.AAC.1